MTGVVELEPSLLVWHEELEHPRLQGLVDALALGHQVPPIDVVPAEGRFLIIDGAHRARAAARHGRSVQARVRRIPADAVVPGWWHAVPAPSAHRLAAAAAGDEAEGHGVAELRHGHLALPLRSADATAAAVHATYHRIAAIAYHLGHRRLSGPAEDPGVGWGALGWQPLPWSLVVEIATTIGPLPAGVTRFASLLGH